MLSDQYILLAANIHILILISLKFTMNCSKIRFRQVHCLNLHGKGEQKESNFREAKENFTL